MSDTPAELKYIAEHQWARKESDGSITVGITDFAQHSLGDVVFVDLPQVGRSVQANEQVSVVESVKTASDVFSPMSGTVLAVNNQLHDEPELVNDDCYAKGWFFKLTPSNMAEWDGLMDAAAYRIECDDD